jgi:hypothetical protein
MTSHGLIREYLRAGLTPDQIYARMGRHRRIWLEAIEEEARLDNELAAFPATPDAVVELRDKRCYRWERVAVRVFGNPREIRRVRELYEQAKGPGSAKKSYTGRGRRFPDME